MALNPNLDPFQKDLDDLRGELQSITTMFRDSSNSIIDSIKKLNKEHGLISDVTLRNFQSIRNIVDRTYTNLNANIGKALKGEISREKVKKEIEKIQEKEKLITSEIANLEKEALTANTKRRKLLLEAAQVLKEQTDYMQDIVGLQLRELDQADLFRKKLQPIIGILKGLAKIPILGNVLNPERGIERATEAAQKGSGTWKILGAGVKGALQGFTSMLKPIAIIVTVISGIVNLVKLWIGGLFDADKMNTNIARNLGVQKDLAQQIRTIYRDNKFGVQDIFFTTQNQVEAAEQLNNLYGTGNILNKELLLSQIQLNKELGLSVEESGQLNKIFINQGLTAEQFRKKIISQTVAINEQKKIQLNFKQIFQDIAKLSSGIIVNYKNQIPLLAQAVTQVKALGLSMEDANQISSSLLDWQSSIENELEAELLTGKELNFETARLLALNNDIAGAAKELMNTTGLTLDSFQDMNAIVKNSLAKSLGLSVEKLSDALLVQKNMIALTKQEKELLDKSNLSEDQKNKLIRERTNINTIDKGLRELTIQEKFNQSLIKAKEIFSDFVSGGTLNKIADLLSSMVNNLSRLLNMVPDYKEQSKGQLNNILKSKEISDSEKKKAEDLQKSMIGKRSFTGALFTPNSQLEFEEAIDKAKLDIIEKIKNKEEVGDEKAIFKNIYKAYTRAFVNRFKSYEVDSDEDIEKMFEKNQDKIISKLKKRSTTGIPVSVHLKGEEENKQDDFIMKGNKIISFRKDDLIMGGTNLLGDKNKKESKIIKEENLNNKEVVSLLREIATAIKEGSIIMMDTQKVGMALAKGTYKTP